MISMRPIILLTCSTMEFPSDARPGQIEADSTPIRRQGVLENYLRCAGLTGGAPLILPNTAPADAVDAAVKSADGLLLTGGGDVRAELYSLPDHPTMSHIDDLRDATEQAAIRHAMKLAKPILCICRGIQILNVALGGTLIQDIPSLPAPGAGKKRVNHQSDHPINIQAGTALCGMWGQRLDVNSSHHQALDKIAPTLKPVAWSDDGIVEAVEPADGYPLLAVQSHPERLAETQGRFLAVFKWLIDAARK